VIRCSDQQGEEYDHAVLTFNERQLRWYLDRMEFANKLREEDSSFNCLEYFDYTPTYHRSFWGIDYLPEQFEDCIDWGEWEPLAYHLWWRLDREPEGKARTDIDRVAIYDDRIHWEACVKHTNCVLETDTLYKAKLLELIEQASLFDTEEPKDVTSKGNAE
jgi:hypothetical protein